MALTPTDVNGNEIESVILTNRAPVGATQVIGKSGNVANAVAAASLPAVANQLNYLAGFVISGAGATAAAVVAVTVTGVLGGTLTFIYCAVAGATLANQALNVTFDPPIPASAANTAIVVSCPALGAGNTNNTAVAHGYVI